MKLSNYEWKNIWGAIINYNNLGRILMGMPLEGKGKGSTEIGSSGCINDQSYCVTT